MAIGYGHNNLGGGWAPAAVCSELDETRSAGYQTAVHATSILPSYVRRFALMNTGGAPALHCGYASVPV